MHRPCYSLLFKRGKSSPWDLCRMANMQLHAAQTRLHVHACTYAAGYTPAQLQGDCQNAAVEEAVCPQAQRSTPSDAATLNMRDI